MKLDVVDPHSGRYQFTTLYVDGFAMCWFHDSGNLRPDHPIYQKTLCGHGMNYLSAIRNWRLYGEA